MTGIRDPDADWLGVERFRGERHRRVVVRRVDRPTLVLGSTQAPTVVDAAAVAAAGVAVARRRSGGGSVLVAPGDPLWLDAWVPRTDPLFDDDVIAAAGWVGEWWSSALVALDVPVPTLAVHRGRSLLTRWSPLVCFAGSGPGEVAVGGRKLVGVAQWRSRQGALFSCASYRRWHPAALVPLLRLDASDAAALRRVLPASAVGLDDLSLGVPAGGDPAAALRSALLDRLPGGGAWAVTDGAP